MSGTNSAAKIKEKIEKFILYSHQKNRKPIKATFMCINTLSKKMKKSFSPGLGKFTSGPGKLPKK